MTIASVRLSAQALALVLLLGACTTAGGDDDFGKASPIGLVVLVLFFIAGIFLMRSMTKHIKKVPPSFGNEAEGGTSADFVDPAKGNSEAMDGKPNDES